MKIIIKQYKQSLKGLPKEVKINIIQQELTNRGLAAMSRPSSGGIDNLNKNTKQYSLTNQQLEKLKREIERNVEAYESETKRKELIPHMYDRDLNWFFNAKNIPAQEKLVMPTYDYFNAGNGKEFFEPLDFLNLLEKQKKDLLDNLDKPFDTLEKLKSIPLTDRELHILFGFVLKWFGGYPVNNLNEQLNIVLKLIEREFLNFPEHTPEKEFCSTDLEIQKKFGEVAAHLNAEMKGVKVITPNDSHLKSKYNFPGSHYINKVVFDFEDLPNYIIERGIISRFENQRINKDSEYFEWKNNLANFLNSIPHEYRMKALTKGIEYGKNVYKYHLNNECTNPSNCSLNQTWERRLSLAKDLLNNFQLDKGDQIIKTKIPSKTTSYNSGFIIHGHNNEKKLEVARFVENDLKRHAIILHEKPNKGRTIMEKFEDFSDVDFAVALWTADDVGNRKINDGLKDRARQNVVFETGFFIGKIGRKNVIVLYEEGVEIPSDYSGVIFLSFNSNWKDDLRKEIDAIYSK